MHRLLALLAIATTTHALDLSPQLTSRYLEGFKLPVLLFRDGARTGRWQPPAGWAHVYADGRLALRSKQYAQALVEFRIQPRKAEDAALTPSAFAKSAASTLPASVVEPQLTGTFPSPFTLGGTETLEFAYSASEFSRPVRASLFFSNISPTERLVVFLVARKDDYPAVRDAVVSSLVGWNWEAAK